MRLVHIRRSVCLGNGFVASTLTVKLRVMNKKISSEITAATRAVKGAFGVKDPHKYSVRSIPLACHICGHDRFDMIPAPVVAKYGLICAKCGHVDLFLKTPELIEAG